MSMMDQLRQGAMAESGLRAVHVPTMSEKKEVETVRGMQVRTQAVVLAVQLMASGHAPEGSLSQWSKAIESYIMEGNFGDGGPAPVPEGL